VGRAEVTPYLSAYATALAPDRYLVDLRNQLAAWGFGRRSEVFEMEDHVSGICDVMRCLIEGGHSLAEQKGFFDEFAYPSAIAFFAAVHNAPDAGFYKLAAEFARELFELERAAFDMEEAC
jgi:TorA maturation chaperone TorD